MTQFYAGYSDDFIGHSGSTCWRKKCSDKAEIFRYLTFINVRKLERHGADIQRNQSMRDRDKM